MTLRYLIWFYKFILLLTICSKTIYGVCEWPKMMIMVFEELILMHQWLKYLDTRFNCSWLAAGLSFLFEFRNIVSSTNRTS